MVHLECSSASCECHSLKCLTLQNALVASGYIPCFIVSRMWSCVADWFKMALFGVSPPYPFFGQCIQNAGSCENVVGMFSVLCGAAVLPPFSPRH